MAHESINEDLSTQLAGKRVTILSIDGGGIRGLIPARIIEFLEEQLQILDGPNARIADYFDVIAGTSTGALIGGLLSVSDEKGRPRFTSQDAMKFYTQEGPNIFMKRSGIPLISQFLGPRYEANGLERLLQDNLKDMKMQDTLIELVIPTFDIKLMEPTYFSTSEAREDESKNVFIRDALRGTTAAPTYFPPALFYTTTSKGERRAYNLVDGGVGINNPTYHSIVHVQKEIFKKNSHFTSRMVTQGYKSLLVVSLGTGTIAESYDSKQASSWGILSWMQNDGKVPMLDIVTGASADVVDFNLSVLFHTQQCPENYLRIQALDLSGEVTSIDNVKSENIQRLKDISDALLDTQVMSPDINTGKYVTQPHQGTNKEALIRFAKKLVGECQARRHLTSKTKGTNSTHV